MSIQVVRDAASKTKSTYVALRAEDLAAAYDALGEGCPDSVLAAHARRVARGDPIPGVPLKMPTVQEESEGVDIRKLNARPDAIIRIHRTAHLGPLLAAADRIETAAAANARTTVETKT